MRVIIHDRLIVRLGWAHAGPQLHHLSAAWLDEVHWSGVVESDKERTM